MTIGIVGSEAAKFTIDNQIAAKLTIRNLIVGYSKVVSGGCHLGGIDIWAIEEAKLAGKYTEEYLPKTRNWEGYKARNILIAMNSDVVICITVEKLPPGYKERGFEKFCYHCKTDEHIKSAGCWTVKFARGIGKLAHTIVLKEPKEFI